MTSNCEISLETLMRESIYKYLPKRLAQNIAKLVDGFI